jgi:hypothetical protein
MLIIDVYGGFIVLMRGKRQAYLDTISDRVVRSCFRFGDCKQISLFKPYIGY